MSLPSPGATAEAAPDDRRASLGRALLRIDIRTAPPGFLVMSLRALLETLDPVAQSNRAFLGAITPVLQAAAGQAVHERAHAAVRMGLEFDRRYREIGAIAARLGGAGDEIVFSAAEAARDLAFLGILLRDETAAIARFATAAA
ncbi:hypothetical protein [Defluviimonas salinarum]|uniref:Uncharacterized protein n=1 Tax=Defluviimonas salinarum TaxID=2992147 RepID=A0ABT3JAJ8_9RHOB|nr:hypothetical protein [Defluviimonas salinarum]MCW3784434.1 hypothetical protein [Defluviimonas salinarum]